MLKAALEALKKKEDASVASKISTQDLKKRTVEMRGEEKILLESSPLNSQMSALLFSSPLRKEAKLQEVSKNVENHEKTTSFSFLLSDNDEDDENDLMTLLTEMDKNMNEKISRRCENINCSVTTSIAHYQNDNITNKNCALIEEFSGIDSLYEYNNEREESKVESMNTFSIGLMPQIDVYTPFDRNHHFLENQKEEFTQTQEQVLHSQNHQISTKKAFSGSLQSSPLHQTHTVLEPIIESQTNSSQNLPLPTQFVKEIMQPETFQLNTLTKNIKSIHVGLHLNPVVVLKSSHSKRVEFPLALMVRDFRQIGATAQVRFIDGSGTEIIGTIPFTACDEVGVKLHFGLILVLTEVATLSPVPGVIYLNISSKNVQKCFSNYNLV